jgi:hypothetical protein
MKKSIFVLTLTALLACPANAQLVPLTPVATTDSCIPINLLAEALNQNAACDNPYISGPYQCVQFAQTLNSNLNQEGLQSWVVTFSPLPTYPSLSAAKDSLCAGHAEIVVQICGGRYCVVEPQSNAIQACWNQQNGEPIVPSSVLQQLISNFPKMLQCQQKYGYNAGSYLIQ